MKSLNRAQFIGYVGADPTVINKDNYCIAKFSIATSESWEDKESGKKEETTQWHNIVCFGKLADITKSFLKKGAQVYVEGKLKNSSWEKDGQKYYATETVADNLIMLDKKGDEK